MHKILLAIFSISLLFACSDSKNVGKKKADDSNCRPAFYDTMTEKYVYRNVDIMPTFPNTETNIHEYIENKLKHVEVLDDDLMFTILLQFVVDSDGSIIGERAFFRSNTSKAKRMQELRKKELQYLQVIRDMPKWNYGKCGDKAVPVILSLPLRVKVSE